MTSTKAREVLDHMADGCHRYGWLITIVTNLILLAYFNGQLTERVNSLKESMNDRVGRLERQIDFLNRRTRGIEDQPSLPSFGVQGSRP